MATTPNYLSDDVLSGNAAPGGDASMEAAPAPAAAPAPDMGAPPQPAMDPGALAGPAAQPAAPAPIQPGPAAAPPPPPVPVKGLAQLIIQGALWGLAGSKGSTSFGGGVSGGAAGYVAGKQQETENAQRTQQLQVESVRAADTHIAALDEHKRADQLSDTAKLDYKQKSAGYQAFLQDNFGVEPNISFADNNSEATAGLQTLANGNPGGTIPPVSAIHHPEGSGTEGKVAVFSPTQQQMRQNSQGFRNLVNTQRAVQGLPEIDDATFNSMGFKGQRDAAQGAIEFMKPTPTFTLDKNKPEYLPNVLAQKKQQLAQYASHKDANGKPDANPNVEKQLQDGISFLQASWDTSNQMENKAASDAVTANAPAKAAAAALQAGAEAKARLPYELAKTKAEEAIKDGDPEAAGKLLVSGDVAPSQLVNSRKPAFAQQAYDAAKRIAGGKWNAQAAEGYFKTASSPANAQFFGSAKSLTDNGGTLDQLETQFAKLPNGQLPAFNKVKDWMSAASGKGAMAGFAQTAVGVADDYAKVMGGGTGSDTSRDQVLQSFAAAHSPEAMAAAIAAARQAVDSQMNGRIGSNPVMKRMYGDQMLVTVTSPTTGAKHVFRSQDQADQYKKAAGMQ